MPVARTLPASGLHICRFNAARTVPMLLLIVLMGCATTQPMSSPTPPVEPLAPATTSPLPAAETTDLTELPPPQGNAEEAIESTRRSVQSTALWLARGVDSWFGDRPFEDGGKVSDGRASIGLSKRQEENAKFSLRFNARFRLPNFERQTYLFLGRDDPRELVSDKPGALSNQDRLLAETKEDRSFFAGLGRDLTDSIDLRVGFRSAKPYAQARYRYGWDIGERSLVEFRQTVFWTIQDRIGSTTALSWERAYTPSLAARWVAAATITQDTGKFGWSSILGGYKSFGERRVLSLEALISGEEGSSVGPSDYGVQARWAQPLFEKRLSGELVLGRFWPRTDVLVERRGVWAVGGNLKMEF